MTIYTHSYYNIKCILLIKKNYRLPPHHCVFQEGNVRIGFPPVSRFTTRNVHARRRYIILYRYQPIIIVLLLLLVASTFHE